MGFLSAGGFSVTIPGISGVLRCAGGFSFLSGKLCGVCVSGISNCSLVDLWGLC